jgi:hypothetical protein
MARQIATSASAIGAGSPPSISCRRISWSEIDWNESGLSMAAPILSVISA